MDFSTYIEDKAEKTISLQRIDAQPPVALVIKKVWNPRNGEQLPNVIVTFNAESRKSFTDHIIDSEAGIVKLQSDIASWQALVADFDATIAEVEV